MTDKIKEQIIAIRNSGKANIEEHPSDYLHFIMMGRD